MDMRSGLLRNRLGLTQLTLQIINTRRFDIGADPKRIFYAWENGDIQKKHTSPLFTNTIHIGEL
jgi:hypothetical protein